MIILMKSLRANRLGQMKHLVSLRAQKGQSRLPVRERFVLIILTIRLRAGPRVDVQASHDVTERYIPITPYAFDIPWV